MSDGEPRIEPLGGTTVFEGRTFSARIERFRHVWPGGREEVVEREVVRRPDATAIVAYDDEHVWLVRQPREAVLEHTLEVPAGKLDVDGESALETAKRELGEEVGLAAGSWEPITSYYASTGYTEEVVHVFAATDLRPVQREDDPGEPIEIVRWPLDDLDGALAATRDVKTLVGLNWLAARRARA